MLKQVYNNNIAAGSVSGIDHFQSIQQISP